MSSVICGYCNKEFESARKLYKHSWNAHMNDFKCNLCSFTAARADTLDRHKYSKHVKERLKCLQCKYSTRRKDSLAKHIKKMHSVTSVWLVVLLISSFTSSVHVVVISEFPFMWNNVPFSWCFFSVPLSSYTFNPLFVNVGCVCRKFKIQIFVEARRIGRHYDVYTLFAST
jgi:hypothetical protein